jgi:hypothetical protein
MKIFFALLIVAVALTTATQAQSDGKITLDLNFQPAAIFDASAGKMFTMPYIKARYFTSSNVAFRVGLGLNASNSKVYSSNSTSNYTQSSAFALTFAPGIEKHFGSEKFFVYLGAELPITSNTTKSDIVTSNQTTHYKNMEGEDYFGIGLNAVFGVDYYLFKNFYIGAELTPGFALKKYKDVEDAGTVTKKGGSYFSLGLAASSGLRVGFRF